MLTRHGVTAWRRALTDLTPDLTPEIRQVPAATAAGAAEALPAQIAAELVHSLAAVVLAGN